MIDRWLVVLLVLWCGGAPSLAAELGPEHAPADRCHYLMAAGRSLDAADIAVGLLAADPNNVEAHVLYIFAWRALGEGNVIEAQYRQWAAAEPDNGVARIGLALAERLTSSNTEEAEADVRELLETLSLSPDQRFWIEFHLPRLDAGDEGVSRARALVAAAEASADPRIDQIATVFRLRVEPVDNGLSADVRKAVREQPTLLGLLGFALWPDLPPGPTSASLRLFAETRAETALRGDDPILVLQAMSLFVQKGDEERVDECSRRLIELDPAWAEVVSDPQGRAIWKATQRFDPQVGLAELEAMEEHIPPEGELRVRYELALARLLDQMEYGADAHWARKRAMEAGATEIHAGNSFAWSALRAGEDLELSLGYLDESLARLEAEDYESDAPMGSVGYARWLDYQNGRFASVHALRAELLDALDRQEEAAGALRRACALADRSADHASLANIYDQLGRVETAYQHRARAVALLYERNGEEARHMPLPERLVAAWEERPYWHPGGLEGYMADRVRALADEDRPPTRHRSDSLPEGTDHPLLRQTFPDLAYQVGKRTRQLSSHDGVLLVQLWNPG